MKILMTLFLLFFSTLVSANQDTLATLLKSVQKLEKQPETPERQKELATLYNTKSQLYLTEHYQVDSCIKYAEKILDHNLVHHLNDDDQGGLFYSFGTANLLVGNFFEAINAYEKAIPLYQALKDSVKTSKCLNNIGVAYYETGNHSEAVGYYIESLKIKEALGDSVAIASTKGNIGVVFHELKDYENAIAYFEEAEKIYREIGKEEKLGNLYNNLGLVYKDFGELEKAKKFYQKAIELATASEDNYVLTSALGNMGNIYLKEELTDSAFHVMMQAAEIEEQEGWQGQLARSHLNIGNTLQDLEKIDESQKYCRQAYDIFKHSNSKTNLIDACKCLSRTYASQKKYEQSLKYLQEAFRLNKEVYNEEKNREVLKKEMRYSYEKQMYADSLRKAEEKKIAQLKHQQEIEAQKTYTYVGFGGFLLLTAIAVLLFRGYNQKKKTNQSLEEKNLLISEKNKEITDSINYAKRIQEAILPSRQTLAENLQNGFVLFKPKDVVSGDFYWMEKTVTNLQEAVGKKAMPSSDNQSKIEIEGGTTYLAAADCTGHGVPGAMVSVICANALSKAVMEEGITRTGEILDRTRELVVERFKKSEEEVKDGMDISLVALAYSAKSESGEQEALLQWSGANNPLWIVSKRATVYEGVKRIVEQDGYFLHEVSADKQPIGKYADPKPFTSHQLTLHEGETIYMFSDGFPDQFGGDKNKKFKSSNFKKLLLSIQEQDMNTQKKRIHEAFEKWKGELEQVDDVCVIGVRV